MLISPDHKVTRGSIGISFQPSMPSAVSRQYGFANGGVIVSTVTSDGPAAKAGVKPDDIIVSVDGKPIKDGDDLVADISTRKVGSTVQLGILRNDSKKTLTVGIADRAKLFADTGNDGDNNSAPSASEASESKLGIQVDPVPAQLASKLGIQGGVIVTSVRPGSFADEIGITQWHCHPRDQQEADRQQVRFQCHRQRPEVRPGCGLQGAIAGTECPRRRLLLWRYLAVTALCGQERAPSGTRSCPKLIRNYSDAAARLGIARVRSVV